MEVTSVIVKSEFKNEWDGPNGKVYYHDILFQNGEKGSIGTKEKNPPKIAAGAELTYTLENGKVKAVQPKNGQTFSGKQGGGKAYEPFEHKAAGFALSYAKDIFEAHLHFGKEDYSTKQMFLLADEMYKWLLSKKQA